MGPKSVKKPKQWPDMVFNTSTDIKLHDLSWWEEEDDFWGLYNDVTEDSIQQWYDAESLGLQVLTLWGHVLSSSSEVRISEKNGILKKKKSWERKHTILYNI